MDLSIIKVNCVTPTILTAILGILTVRFGITLIGSADSKIIAISAAMIWIFFGSVLAYQAVKPMQQSAGLVVPLVLLFIAVIESIEFIFSIQGDHFFIEPLFVRVGMTILGPLSSSISPVASGLAVLAALALVFVIRKSSIPGDHSRVPEVISILGMVISVISFMFVLSYAYDEPLLYGTQYIPIAPFSALSAFFIGIAVIAAAGPGGVPARYMIGNTTSAGLFRVFVPLVVGTILFENVLFVGLSSWFIIHDAVLFSAILVAFTFATAFVVAWVSRGMGRALDRAEQKLVRKNADLNTMNEELIAVEEELRSNIEDLTRAEKAVRESEEKFRTVADYTSDWEYWLGPDNHLVYVSPSCEQITGYKAQEFMNNRQILDNIVHPEDNVSYIEHRMRQGETGDIDPVDIRIIRKDGEVRWIGHACRPVFSRDGTPMGRRVSNRDITGRKNAEDELNRKYDEINALNEELIQAEMDLKAANELLEQRVANRTMELEKQ